MTSIKNRFGLIVGLGISTFILWVLRTLFDSSQDEPAAPLVSNFESTNVKTKLVVTTKVADLTNANTNDIESEWHRRWNECDKIWLDSLNNLPKLRKASDSVPVDHYNYSDTCFYNPDNLRGGIGNKFERQSLAFLHASHNYCKLGISWGWFESKCLDPIPYIESIQTGTHKNPINYNFNRNLFEYIWNDNLEFRAFVNTSRDKNENKQIMSGSARNTIDENWLKYYKKIDGVHKLNAQFYLLTYDFYNTFIYKKIEHLRNDFDFVNKTFCYQNLDNEWFFMRPYLSYMSFFAVQRFYGLLVKNLHSIWREKTIQFMKNEFEGYFIIGTHLRFGNGENFTYYGRDIGSTGDHIARQFIVLLQNINNVLPFIGNDKYQLPTINAKNTKLAVDISKIKIFIASDTLSIIDIIRKQIANNVKGFKEEQIISLPQTRLPPRYGHLFSIKQVINSSYIANGNANGKERKKIDCVDNMASAYLDSEILGFSDFLILPIASTYTRLSRLLILKRKKNLCVRTENNGNIWKCINFAKYGNYPLIEEKTNDNIINNTQIYDSNYNRLHQKWHISFKLTNATIGTSDIFNDDNNNIDNSNFGTIKIVDDFAKVYHHFIEWEKKQKKSRQKQQQRANVAAARGKASAKVKQLFSDIDYIDNLYMDNKHAKSLFDRVVTLTDGAQTGVDLSKYGEKWKINKQGGDDNSKSKSISNLPSVLFIAGTFGSGHEIIRRFAYLMHKKSSKFIMRQFSNYRFFRAIRECLVEQIGASCGTFEQGLKAYNDKEIFVNNSVFMLGGENEMFTYPMVTYENEESGDSLLKFSNFVPDLVKLIENTTFVTESQKEQQLLDYRVIVLKRDIIECLYILCSITKDCDENNINQRLDFLTIGLKLIETQLLSIDVTKWILIDSNDIVQQPSHYVNILAKFFNIRNEKDLKNVLNGVQRLLIQSHEKKMSAMAEKFEQLSNIAKQYWDKKYANLYWPVFGNEFFVAKPSINE